MDKKPVDKKPLKLSSPIDDDSIIFEMTDQSRIMVLAVANLRSDLLGNLRLDEATDALLLLLSEGERDVFLKRLGVGTADGSQMTLKDIGEEKDVSRQRVQQFEVRAIRKLDKFGAHEVDLWKARPLAVRQEQRRNAKTLMTAIMGKSDSVVRYSKGIRKTKLSV